MRKHYGSYLPFPGRLSVIRWHFAWVERWLFSLFVGHSIDNDVTITAFSQLWSFQQQAKIYEEVTDLGFLDKQDWDLAAQLVECWTVGHRITGSSPGRERHRSTLCESETVSLSVPPQCHRHFHFPRSADDTQTRTHHGSAIFVAAIFFLLEKSTLIDQFRK